MTKVVIWFIVLLTLATLSIADSNLYLLDSLQIQLDLSGKFTLSSEVLSAQTQKVTTELNLVPKNDYRQQVQEIDQMFGKQLNNKIIYEWNNVNLGEKEFGYSALINTKNERVKVQFMVPFPLRDVKEFEQYTWPTETIDSNDPEVIAKAAELAEGEDDAFKVAFKLASWVEENVKYDLNTLTAKTSQKASWVLENRQGVCDEMTSLFIAMCRSLGIPARFVSGVSYSNSPLFNEPWQPHGWAEVYFPEIGWVSFDTAFGEFGYVDVTHIKLRETLDSDEPATKYEWLGNNIKLSSDPLKFKIETLKEGIEEEEEVQFEQEIEASEVDFGSYNLIRGILKNNADYYVATTLQLAVPKEIQILGRNKRTILLAPKEVKETYWRVKIPEDLDSKYWYNFPTRIYSEKNVSAENQFQVQRGKPIYSFNDVQKLMVVEEDRSYSRKVSLTCDVPKSVYLNQSKEANCTIKNLGDQNLGEVRFCIGGVCENINLPINSVKNSQIKLKSDKVGWNKLIVSSENEIIDKKMSFDYSVLDKPRLTVEVKAPEIVKLGEGFEMQLILNRTSFTPPKDVHISITGAGVEQRLELEELKESQLTIIELSSERFGKSNNYLLNATWKDPLNQSYSEVQNILIKGKGETFSQKVKLFLNSIIGAFQ
ncbi:MAG: transglutaminase-like domain-containing protein [Candidatus Woesearchaeota archaeon]